MYRHVLQKPPPEPREVEKPVLKEETMSAGYSYLDGYHPPNLLASNHSSDDDDSVQSGGNLIINAPTTIEKEVY